MSEILNDYIDDLISFIESSELPPPADRSARDLITATGLQRIAVERYTSEARCADEKQQLFGRYPLVLGHASEIAAGHARNHDAAGTPLLISNDGERIRVFLNQCRHRSTQLLTDNTPCAQKSIICPYHRWVYGLDGELRNVPRTELFDGLDKTAHGLIEVPSEVRHGLIFAHTDPNANLQLDRELDGIGPYLDALHTEDFVFFRQSDRIWKCNWKLPIDAFLEAYHIHQLHVETLAPLFEDDIAIARSHGFHLSAAVARKDILQARETPRDQRDLRNLVTFTLYLLPNTVIIYHPDYTSIVSFYPVAAGSCRIVHSMLIPEAPASEGARGHWDRAFELTDGMSFGDEDFAISERMQKGMSAGGMSELLLGSSESGIRRFHEILDAMAADPIRVDG